MYTPFWHLITVHGFPEFNRPVYILIEDSVLYGDEGQYPVVEEAILEFHLTGNPQYVWKIANPFDKSEEFVLQSETVHAWRYKS